MRTINITAGNSYRVTITWVTWATALVLLATGLPAFVSAQGPASIHTQVGRVKMRKQRPACSDRRDNDRDGRIDYPLDPGCRNRRDRSERNKVRIPGPTPASSSPPTINEPLGGRRLFPADNPWNQDISSLPVDPQSDTLIASIGTEVRLHPDFGTTWEGRPIGFDNVVVPGNYPKSSVSFLNANESDPGPYPTSHPTRQ